MRPEDRKSLNKWKRLTETLKYEEITRTATKKYVYVGVIVNNDILELTISNNPAISTSNSSFYYWSERSLLQNSWLNVYDSKVDILNINIDNDIEINKVICKWVDIVDMLSININIEKDGIIIWEDYFNHSGFNMLERYWNIKGFILDKAKIKTHCSVKIKKYAHSSSTEQKLKYWMLSNQGAIIEASPQLDVFTDNVIEASHGAAIGSIEKEIINHMRMRGLDLGKIFRILIQGILNDSVSVFYDNTNIINNNDWLNIIHDKIDNIVRDDEWISSAIDFWSSQYKE